jgi:hypothetical protein
MRIHTVKRGAAKTLLLSVTLAIASVGTVAAGSAQLVHAAATTGPAFTPNLKLVSATSVGGVLVTSPAEPSIRVSNQGDIYVGAPAAVGLGCAFWQVSPTATSSTLKGVSDNGAGGGDCDLATSFLPQISAPGTGKDVIAASSLTAANITASASFNQGTTWLTNPLAQQITGVDREWDTPGSHSNPLDFYLVYKSVGLANAYTAHSTDGGLTYTQTGVPIDINPSSPTAHFTAHISNIVADSTGTKLYVLFNQNTAETTIWLAESTDSGVTWSQGAIHSGSISFGHIFDSIALDPNDNTLYAVYSDEHNIHFATSSVANALTSPWSDSIVPVLDSTKTNIMPWVYSNKTGQADLVWYGTPDTTEAATSPWNVYFARWTGGPDFAVSKVSDHVIHTGFICETGTGCSGTVGTSGDRTLLDFFQVADDTNGVAHVAWADDHTTPGTPFIYYAREVSQQQPCVGCIPETPWVPALLLLPGAAALIGVGFIRRRQGASHRHFPDAT